MVRKGCQLRAEMAENATSAQKWLERECHFRVELAFSLENLKKEEQVGDFGAAGL